MKIKSSPGIDYWRVRGVLGAAGGYALSKRAWFALDWRFEIYFGGISKFMLL
jgi:hypothetical protein